MQAVILAAGRGSRMGTKGDNLPKCLLQVGGFPLIEHQLLVLAEAGVSPVLVVVGYGADLVREAIGNKAETILNARYEKTNSLYSFLLAQDWIRGPVLILNSDVLIHRGILDALLRTGPDSLAFDSTSGFAPEHMKVLVREGSVCNLSKDLPENQIGGENVGLIYLGESAIRAARTHGERLIAAGREDAFLAEAINAVAGEHTIRAVDIAGLPWIEIDSSFDLDRARREVWPAIQSRMGPGLLKRRRKRRLMLSLAALVFLGLLAVTWLVSSRYSVEEWVSVPLQSTKRTDLMVRGLHQEWWLAGKQESIRTSLNGPRAARVDVRCLLQSGSRHRVPYVVEVKIDGKVEDWYRFRATPTTTATVPGATVSDRDKIEIEISEGDHLIEVRLVAGDVEGLLVRMRTMDVPE